MAVNLSIINFGQFARVVPVEATPVAPQRPVAGPATDIAELSLARYQLLRLRDALAEALDASGASRLTDTATVTVGSNGPLALDNSTRAAALASVAEINTSPTSFTPFGPDWSGASTALATIGGLYDGSNGTGALSFEARTNGVHGQDRLRIRIRDANDNIITNVVIRETHPLDRQYDIGNGLYFTLGAGSLVRNETFSLNVADSVGSIVSTSNPFDGVRNANPNLDVGQTVTNGILTINGTDVAVSAGDSIDTVMTAINQSAAGVTAVFDPATEGLQLTQNTAGATPTIDIQADDSGFTAATKLAGATVVPGKDPDLVAQLEKVGQFSSVQSGTISVNGRPVAIDVTTDSLADVLQRINTVSSEVTATYSEPPQQVSFASNRPINLDDGGTGFLAALNISPGPYRATAGNALSGQRAAAVTRAVEHVASLLNRFLAADDDGGSSPAIRGQLAAVLAGFVPADDPRGHAFGLRFASGSGRTRLDAQVLTRNLQNNAADTLAFLNGSDSRAGFLSATARSVDQAIAQLNERLGLRGSTINQRV